MGQEAHLVLGQVGLPAASARLAAGLSIWGWPDSTQVAQLPAETSVCLWSVCYAQGPIRCCSKRCSPQAGKTAAPGTMVRCIGYNLQHVQPPHVYGDSRASAQHYSAPVHMPMIHDYHACTAHKCCSGNSTTLRPHGCRRTPTRIACGAPRQEGSKDRQAPGSCLRQHLPKARSRAACTCTSGTPAALQRGRSPLGPSACQQPAGSNACTHCILRGSRVHPVGAPHASHAQPCPAMVWHEGSVPVLWTLLAGCQVEVEHWTAGCQKVSAWSSLEVCF